MHHSLLQDVVTANPETWSFDPFQLTRDGDRLQGRGVTDCLGHVALMTELFRLATLDTSRKHQSLILKHPPSQFGCTPPVQTLSRPGCKQFREVDICDAYLQCMKCFCMGLVST